MVDVVFIAKAYKNNIPLQTALLLGEDVDEEEENKPVSFDL
jgi:hypothetical protein